jgi:hypothetical protein
VDCSCPPASLAGPVGPAGGTEFNRKETIMFFAQPLAGIEFLEGRVFLSASHFQKLEFEADLVGAEEVPPRQTDAQGELEMKFNKKASKLWFKLEVEDIMNVVGAHLHLAPRGENGPIVVPLFSADPGGGPFDGVLAKGIITADDLTGPLEGMKLKDLISAIKAGNIYVNVHTNDGVGEENTGAGDFPGGEIRGQVAVDEKKGRNREDDDKPHGADQKQADQANKNKWWKKMPKKPVMAG